MSRRSLSHRRNKTPLGRLINAWLWRWELFRIHLRYGWKLDRLLADSLALNEDVLEAMYGETPSHREIMQRVEELRRRPAGIPGYYPTTPGFYCQPNPYGGDHYD